MTALDKLRKDFDEMHIHGNLIAETNHEKWRELFMSEPVAHDDQACMALIEYEEYCRPLEKNLSPGQRSLIKPNKMQEIADKFCTTTQRMKEHWRCVDRVLGIDPSEIRRK